MDVNTQLDGFIVHPLDAFNDKHHDDNIPKFSSTAPHLDGFIVHPIDSFISHERNGGNGFSGINQINNIFNNNNNYETENIFNQNNDLTNFEVNQTSQIQDLYNTTPINNNEFNFNQYETSNLTTSEYPITHTEPTIKNYNYNYTNSTTSDIIPSIPEKNNINSTSSYTNYSNYSNYTNYSSPTTDFQYSQILPTKYLPTMFSNNNDINSTSISQVGEIPVTSYTSSVKIPYNNSYSISSPQEYSIKTYKPVIKMKAFTSQVLPKATKTKNKTKYIYNTYSVSAPKKYRITTFNPQIKWKKIIPLKKKIIIPKVKKYIIPRRTTYLVPKKKSVIIPKPVLTQAHIIQNNSIIVPTISIVTPGIEKYPLDNFDGRNRLVSGMVTGAKIYVPKDLEMKRRNKF